jgi:hypothetical protein
MAAAAKSAEADRAIVIGIGNYQRFGPQQSANDLSGPVADATDVAHWLAKKAKANVTLLTSNGRKGEKWKVTEMRPMAQDVEAPLNDLVVESITRVAAGKPSRIARRLYIYVAGHGFMPEADHVALVTAESMERDFVRSVEMTVWADWFADQYHFDELVLWMDCCADRDFYQKGLAPIYPRSAPRPGRAKMFVAYAAKPNQAAYEGPIGPKGEIRGLFTAKLLKALDGAGADSQGRITSLGIKGYLEGNGLIGEGASDSVKAEHYVPKFDPILFAKVPVTTPKYNLLVPVADGETVVVSYGADVELTSEIVADGRIAVALTAGLYKATGPGGYRKLFEIAAGSPTDVDLR